ncbi:uncharacterized protein LOC131071711 [Cryptomeria japonica]|uniref:uncharacterized protein LOC131071711 n=1 Tax=Cryptomeria japonica TaxID=3369 RepID=UPI0027DA6EB3|nr:uncharacterized protein LOC131071711 [Cryptomeria japonica]
MSHKISKRPSNNSQQPQSIKDRQHCNRQPTFIQPYQKKKYQATSTNSNQAYIDQIKGLLYIADNSNLIHLCVKEEIRDKEAAALTPETSAPTPGVGPRGQMSGSSFHALGLDWEGQAPGALYDSPKDSIVWIGW